MVGVKEGAIARFDMKTGALTGTFRPVEGQASNMMAFSAKERRIFISDSQMTSAITAIDPDTEKLIGKVAFSKKSTPAWGMQVDEASNLLFAALPNANAVGILDVKTLEPLGLLPVGTCPYAVRLDTARGKGYTTNQVDGTLSVFDLEKVRKAVGR
jgi:DNA-binding beta-propeller fold protein YncE